MIRTFHFAKLNPIGVMVFVGKWENKVHIKLKTFLCVKKTDILQNIAWLKHKA